MDTSPVIRVRNGIRTAEIFENDCRKLNHPWYFTRPVKGLSDGVFTEVDATSSEADAALFPMRF